MTVRFYLRPFRLNTKSDGTPVLDQRSWLRVSAAMWPPSLMVTRFHSRILAFQGLRKTITLIHNTGGCGALNSGWNRLFWIGCRLGKGRWISYLVRTLLQISTEMGSLKLRSRDGIVGAITGQMGWVDDPGYKAIQNCAPNRAGRSVAVFLYGFKKTPATLPIPVVVQRVGVFSGENFPWQGYGTVSPQFWRTYQKVVTCDCCVAAVYGEYLFCIWAKISDAQQIFRGAELSFKGQIAIRLSFWIHCISHFSDLRKWKK